MTALGRTMVANSDAASLVLEGHAMATGHLLLQGWSLSLDSFWTSEVPLYALATAVLGVSPSVITVTTAVLAALLVVVGAGIAAEGHRGAAAAAGAVTVLGLLALPDHALASFLLLGGSHLGAALWALVAFLALRRGRWGPGVAIAAVALAIGLLGDLQEVAYGVGPVLGAGLLLMLRRRALRAGLPLLSAAVASVVCSLAVRLLVGRFGAFTIGSANAFASPGQLLRNVPRGFEELAQFLGPWSSLYGPGGAPAVLQDLRAAGLVLVAGALLWGAVQLVSGAARPAGPPGTTPTRPLDDLLVLACFCSAASFVAMAYNDSPAFGRYLTATAVFLVVLTGRAVARAWSRFGRGARQGFAGGGIALLACFAAALGTMVTVPAPTTTTTVLTDWLAGHHLTSGLGPYWTANIATVDSHDRVQIRPVICDPQGTLVRYDRESQAGWYRGTRFRYLVYQPGAPWEDVNLTSAERTWGRPAHVYSLAGYLVLAWDRPLTLSPTGGYGSGSFPPDPCPSG